MTIADVLIKQILAETPWHTPEQTCPDDEMPAEELLPEGVFADAPDMEIFRHRLPDCGDESWENNEEIILLGRYQWMHSPGVITLYRRNIEACWHSLIKHAQKQFPFISREDAKRVLQLLVNAVYQHERFHYVCDFSRHLFNSPFDRLHEEALAVAHEWQWLKSQDSGNTTYGRIHPTLRRIVVAEMFNHQSPGYCDWRLFAAQASFYNAVRDYLHPGAAQIFAGTDFDFGRWVAGNVLDDGNKAWIERVG